MPSSFGPRVITRSPNSSPKNMAQNGTRELDKKKMGPTGSRRLWLRLRMLSKPMQAIAGTMILIASLYCLSAVFIIIRMIPQSSSIMSQSPHRSVHFYNKPGEYGYDAQWSMKPRVVQIIFQGDSAVHYYLHPSDKEGESWSKHFDGMLTNLTDRIPSTTLNDGKSHERHHHIHFDHLARLDVNSLTAADELERGRCHRAADWQIDHKPSCNVIHESMSSFFPMGKEDSENDTRMIGGGAFRHVWRITDGAFYENGVMHSQTPRVLKTLRVDSRSKNFDLRSLDRHRRDAMSMEQLTSSPLIVDIYGHCANSALFDYGAGGDLSNIFADKRNDVSPKRLLDLAYNATLAISHAHHYDKHGRPTIAHTDIKVDQFLLNNAGYYQLSDFNRVRFLTYEHERSVRRMLGVGDETAVEMSACGFRVGKNGGVWRSPEEYQYDIETNAVDVYSMGNVLFFLLTRKIPWLETSSMSRSEIYSAVKKGGRPEISHEILEKAKQESVYVYEHYMLKAIQQCWVQDPSQRPTALEVAETLKQGLSKL